MIDVIQVLTTTASKEEADHIARILLTRRLAACVQVAGPVTSTYHWQGKIETSQEWVCAIKTRQTHYAALETAIRELHSYEVPEIVAFPAIACSGPYGQWLQSELSDSAGPQIV